MKHIKFEKYISSILYNLHISTFKHKWKLKTDFPTNSYSLFIVRLSFWFIWGVILFHPNLFATPQEPDELIINDKSYPLLTPLFDDELSSFTREKLFTEILKEVERKKISMALSSSLRRGWKCKWRILNNCLHLENIEIINANHDSNEHRYISLGKPCITIPYYHNKSNRYDYSGRIIIALGNELGSDMRALSGNTYPAVMVLDIKNGLITQQNIAYCINPHNKGMITRYCKNSDNHYKINILVYNQMSIPCTIHYSKIIKCNLNEKKIVIESNSIIPISLELLIDDKDNTKYEVPLAIIPDHFSLSFFVDNIYQLFSKQQETFKVLSYSSYLHIVTYDDKGMASIRKYLEDITMPLKPTEIYWKSFSDHMLDLFMKGEKNTQ